MTGVIEGLTKWYFNIRSRGHGLSFHCHDEGQETFPEDKAKDQHHWYCVSRIMIRSHELLWLCVNLHRVKPYSTDVEFYMCYVNWRYQLCWSKVGNTSAADSTLDAVHCRLRLYRRIICPHWSRSVVYVLFALLDPVPYFTTMGHVSHYHCLVQLVTTL